MKKQTDSRKSKPSGVGRSDLLCGVELIAAERVRQIEKEGWTGEHDDSHGSGELGEAAECYIRQARGRAWMPRKAYQKDEVPHSWPWEPDDWKPKSPIRDLTRAGALIAAEIDRLQRIEARAT